jgi:lipid II:glycine glycyltransferase (peptidoglycan interpeptide bridge formation enzyme)
MLDIRQTRRYGEYLRENGWTVERIGNNNYFIKKFPLIGSILKLQRPEKIDITSINRIIEKHRTFQVIVEPKDESQAAILASNGYKLAKSTYLPSKTLQIDLTKSEKDILSAFKKDARSLVKRGEGNIIKTYSTPEEIYLWRNAWKNSVNYSRYVPTLETLLKIRKSFPQSSSLFLASHNIVGRIIGGALFTTSSHDGSNYITYYWYGFTNKEGRSTLSQYSLLYHGILWAKKQGYKVFDFEGIYDERFPNKSWLGFTHFKRSFGGQVVLYPGCYTRLRLPI